MKQVFLKFKELELGYLTEQDNSYLWVPNTKNYQIFTEKYSAVTDLFFLNPLKLCDFRIKHNH